MHHAVRQAPTRLLLAALVVVAACGGKDDSSEATPRATVRHDASSQAGFFDFPWPADARANPDGTVDTSSFPNPNGLGGIAEMTQMTSTVVDGFSPSGVAYFRLDRSIAGVVPMADPTDTTGPGASYFFVNLEDGPSFGSRTPALIDYAEEADSYRPGQLLSVLPVSGNLLEPRSLNAAVVLRTAFVNPREVAPAPELAAVLRGRGELADDFEPLRRYLAAEGIDRRDVIAATVFTTGDKTRRLQGFVDQVEALPPPQVAEPLELFHEQEEYCAFRGTYLVPAYQDGTPPYFTRGGVIQTDADGRLVRTRLDEVPYVISFPKRRMPDAGYPMLMYVHGTGGTSDQIVSRGPVLEVGGPSTFGEGPAWLAANRGYGSAGVAGPLNPERIGAASAGGYIAYNFLHPPAMRDNFAQMILDLVELRKFLEVVEVDAERCPGASSADGLLRYDPDFFVVTGQSLGAYLTGMFVSLVDGIPGAILTGAGGGWGEFALGPADPPLPPILKAYLGMSAAERLDLFHPVIAVFDLAVAEADNLHYVRRILRDPPPDRSIPHVVVLEGTVDLQTTANLQRAVLAALGVDMLGSSQTTVPDERLEDAIRISGGALLDGPVRANRQRPDGRPQTQVVVRYAEDGIREGHYVAFQRDDARHSYGCFLETIRRDPEGVPTVIRGDTVNGPCP